MLSYTGSFSKERLSCRLRPCSGDDAGAIGPVDFCALRIRGIVTHTTIPEVQELALDRALLQKIVRKRQWLWAAIGPLACVGFCLFGMFRVPQSYAASVSISMLQSTGGGVSLLGFPGLGGGPKKYIGAIRSRSFAAYVERRVNVQGLYNLPSEDEAIDRIARAVKVDDNAVDGLLYVTVTLDGPPRFSRDLYGQRPRVLDTVTEAANSYAHALSNYLQDTDKERDTLLVNHAANEEHKAYANYFKAVDKLIEFAHKNERLMPNGSSGTGAADAARSGGDTGASVTELASLYTRQAQIEGRLRAADVARRETSRLLDTRNVDPTALPTEDPILTAARRQVTTARAQLQDLLITLGPENSQVVVARTRLEKAQARLREQMEAVKNGLTSDEVSRRALQEEYNTVQEQIARAERKYRANRQVSLQFEQLRNELTLRFETLKTTVTKKAELSLQTISGKNRMTVVDSARVPQYGSPSLTVILLWSAVGALALIGVLAAVEYLFQARLQARRRASLAV